MLKRELEKLVKELREEVEYLNGLIVGKDSLQLVTSRAKALVDEKLALTEARLKECEKVLDGAGKTIKTMHNTIVVSAIREATGRVVEVNPDAERVVKP